MIESLSSTFNSAGKNSNKWMRAVATINATAPFQLIIEGFVNERRKAIAIDDVSFTPDCHYSQINTLPALTTPRPATNKPPTTTTPHSTKAGQTNAPTQVRNIYNYFDQYHIQRSTFSEATCVSLYYDLTCIIWNRGT